MRFFRIYAPILSYMRLKSYLKETYVSTRLSIASVLRLSGKEPYCCYTELVARREFLKLSAIRLKFLLWARSCPFMRMWFSLRQRISSRKSSYFSSISKKTLCLKNYTILMHCFGCLLKRVSHEFLFSKTLDRVNTLNKEPRVKAIADCNSLEVLNAVCVAHIILQYIHLYLALEHFVLNGVTLSI